MTHFIKPLIFCPFRQPATSLSSNNPSCNPPRAVTPRHVTDGSPKSDTILHYKMVTVPSTFAREYHIKVCYHFGEKRGCFWFVQPYFNSTFVMSCKILLFLKMKNKTCPASELVVIDQFECFRFFFKNHKWLVNMKYKKYKPDFNFFYTLGLIPLSIPIQSPEKPSRRCLKMP